MTNTVYVKTYDAPHVDMGEIMRYAGVRGDAPELSEMIRVCLDEVKTQLIYKVCYLEIPVVHRGDLLDLGFFQTASEALKKNLAGCERAVVFAATVGIGLDRLIARYSTLSPTKALLFQAIGAERIESLCDTFNRELNERLAAEGYGTRPRFSPGYGDLPLGVQKEFFSVLDCPRKIGLTLNESMLMSPSKSVTALIGITNGTGCREEASKCGACENTDCGFRRNTEV